MKPKFEQGQLPPQETELEATIIGTAMIQKSSLDIILSILKSDHFYLHSHKRIFKSIEILYKEKSPVDMLTVIHKLKYEGDLDAIGGSYFISQLASKVGGGGDIETHARIILQAYMSRRLTEIGGAIRNAGFDDSIDVFDKIEVLNKGMLEMASIISSKKAISTTELVNLAIEQSKNYSESKGEPEIQTPFHALNKVLGGLARGALITVGARPAMGKSSLVVDLAKFAGDNGSPVVIFSYEETAIAIIYKLLSGITHIPAGKIKRGQLTELELKKVEDARAKINNNLIIYANPYLTPREVAAIMRKHIAEDGTKMCVIDYVQMVPPDEKKRNREEEISSITRAFKKMAMELDIPVIECASLSREVERREDKSPMLHDLRESGSIESDSDVVIFLYRPEYYKIFEDKKGDSVKGLCEIIIAKHRGGETGFIKLKFIDYLTKFEDWKSEENVFIPVGFPNSSDDTKENDNPPF